MSPLVRIRKAWPLSGLLAVALLGFVGYVLLKTTALLSVLGLDDVLRKASLAAGATRQPFTFYITAGIVYLLMTTVSVIVFHYLERRFAVAYARPSHGH